MLGEENFDYIIIAHTNTIIKPKPHPQGLEECLKGMKIQKDKAIYVGNADEDIQTAKNAQVFDVLLDRGEHKFPEINPSLKIYSLYELRKFLDFN